jgi:hypothetical protein
MTSSPHNSGPAVGSMRPAAWMRVFASTLRRLYPQTGADLAGRIAHKRFAIDAESDPVRAAELYALSEGKPSSSSSA